MGLKPLRGRQFGQHTQDGLLRHHGGAACVAPPFFSPLRFQVDDTYRRVVVGEQLHRLQQLRPIPTGSAQNIGFCQQAQQFYAEIRQKLPIRRRFQKPSRAVRLISRVEGQGMVADEGAHRLPQGLSVRVQAQQPGVFTEMLDMRPRDITGRSQQGKEGAFVLKFPLGQHRHGHDSRGRCVPSSPRPAVRLPAPHIPHR